MATKMARRRADVASALRGAARLIEDGTVEFSCVALADAAGWWLTPESCQRQVWWRRWREGRLPSSLLKAAADTYAALLGRLPEIDDFTEIGTYADHPDRDHRVTALCFAAALAEDGITVHDIGRERQHG